MCGLFNAQSILSVVIGGRLNTNVRSPKIIKDGEARDKLGTTSDSSTVGKLHSIGEMAYRGHRLPFN